MSIAPRSACSARGTDCSAPSCSSSAPTVPSAFAGPRRRAPHARRLLGDLGAHNLQPRARGSYCHPRLPPRCERIRRARARRRRRAGRAQHGAPREGRARLPAGVAHRGRAEKVPLPIREIAFRKLRKDEKKLARQVEEARAAREAAAARGAQEKAAEEARAAAGEPAPAAGAGPAAAAGGSAPSAPSSPATPSAAIRTSPTSIGGWATSSPSPSAPFVATSWTATSPGSTPTAAAARS